MNRFCDVFRYKKALPLTAGRGKLFEVILGKTGVFNA